jgi:hypothetical protein
MFFGTRLGHMASEDDIPFKFEKSGVYTTYLNGSFEQGMFTLQSPVRVCQNAIYT